jgi:hypothetical protein
MSSRFFPLPVLALLMGASLQAQELPSRVGLSFAYIAPQGGWKDSYPSGGALSLGIFFNREGSHEQRLRIDVIGMKEFKESGRYQGSSYTVQADAAGVGVGYDWLPRAAAWGNGGGFHFVLGVGGISWAQRVQANGRSPYGSYSVDETDNGVAFSPTVGFQVRFNRYVNLEARYTWSRITVSSNSDLVSEDLNHGTIALGFRF